MRSFFEHLLRRRVLVLALAGILTIAGGIAWNSLPIDAFPDVTNVQVMVLTESPGLSPVDVEQQVTWPIEQQMGGVPGVSQVRSLSKAGFSQVVVVFQDGTDIYFARQQVLERLQGARENLPSFAFPELGPISTGLGEIFQYTLEGEGLTPTELRTIQEFIVSPRLKAIPGVNEVNSFGGFVKQFHVLVRPEALIKYDLTLREVVEAIERNNANAAGGYIVRGWEQTYIRGLGQLAEPRDIGEVVLKTVGGIPVHVHDVASVTEGAMTRQGAVTRDGRGEVVAGMVIMLRGENSREVVSRVKEAVPAVQRSLPETARIEVFYDRTSLIQACIQTVVSALLQGGFLVILVLFLLLGEFRTAMIVVAALPLTYLCAFLLMGWAGITANLMSLGGLAFSVGMVVDASIVIVENIRRHLSERSGHGERVPITARAIAEVFRPVAFSVLVIVIVMVPLFSLQGIEGKMFAPLALTMILAMLSSLFVALTVVPVLSELFLGSARTEEFGFIRRLREGYRTILGVARQYRAVTLAIAGASLLAAGAAATRIGTEFMPYLDEGSIAVNVIRLPNASLKGSVAVAGFMEKRLLENFPEVSTVVSKTGRAEISEDPMGPEQSDLFIMLKPRNEWTTGRSREQLVEAIQEDLSAVPGIRMSFSQPIALRVNELISGVKSDLAVKVYGEDLGKLKEYGDRIASVLTGIPGARDVKVEQVSGMEFVEMEWDRAAMARFGIAVADVNDMLETAVAGRTATRVIEGPKRIDTVVRFPEAYRSDLGSLQGILVGNGEDVRVPIGRLARIRTVEGPAQITREKGIRRVAAEANVRGRDLGGFVREAQGSLAALEQELPPGYFLEYGGQFENQQRAMRRLSLVVPLALLLILFLLYLALGSIRDSLLVFLVLPFALVGGILAVWGAGIHLSVSAAVAFIALLGIAVQNGVVLVSFFRHLRDEGKTVNETVEIGCDLRFRPLLMTALTSLIGYLPLLYASGPGADIQRPLAVVVMGGLVTSTVLTLIVLPTVYGWMEGRAEKRETGSIPDST